MVENLQTAFMNSRDEEADYKRLRHLIDTATKYSPTAAAVIGAAKTGYCFEEIDSIGSCDILLGLVRLHPKYPDEMLLSTLVHECRHAVQQVKGEGSQYDIRTNLQWNRAMEADAMAFQCAAAYEMKDDLPAVWAAFNREHPQVALSYAGTLKNTDDQDKALSAAFKAWHDDEKYVAGYDSRQIEWVQKWALKSESKETLSAAIAPEQIGEEICRQNGKSYLEKGFMSSDKALTVREWDIWPKIVQLKYDVADRTGVMDRSPEELFTRNVFGKPVSRRMDMPVPAVKDISERHEPASPAETTFSKQAPPVRTVPAPAPRPQPGSSAASLKDRIAAMRAGLGR